ncbi:hypothetical protein [Aliikangiella sp. IMCC44359]|uniref:hypothetical protein n=1 Tax=Aliikangiella sp. IMCC44359 TaxID=3459125 RepID=UPI00403B15DA
MRFLLIGLMFNIAAFYSGGTAIASQFYADILRENITNTVEVNNGSKSSIFDLSSITNGTPGHVRFYYKCNVLGANAGAYNSLDFLDSTGTSILNVTGCDLSGVSNSESSESNGTRILQIPVNTTQIKLYGVLAGAISNANNSANTNINVLGRLTPFALDFSSMSFYDVSANNSAQNTSDVYAVQDSGATFYLSDNTWKAAGFNYTITANTVIQFDFLSNKEGEIHAIGLSNTLNVDFSKMFVLSGIQAGSITPAPIYSFDNYSSNEGVWVTYTIPIGTFYAGNINYLIFVNDDDRSAPNANSYFRNVRVFED